MSKTQDLTFRFNEIQGARDFADLLAQVSSHRLTPALAGREVHVRIPNELREGLMEEANKRGGYIPGKPTFF